mgnify:CR=1 FL=1
MKRNPFIALLLTLMMILQLPVQVFAQETTDFTFTAETGTITKYTGTATDLRIPDAIDEVSVTAIGQGVFGRKGITSVQFPETLEEIGRIAFFNNPLTQLDFPSSLQTIGDRAFANNDSLTQILFTEGLTHIGPMSFQNDTALSGEVALPDSLQEVGRLAFDKTSVVPVLQGGESAKPIVFKDQALRGTGISVWNLPQNRDILLYYNVMGDAITEPVQLHGGDIFLPAHASDDEIRAALAETYPLYSGFSIINNTDPSGASDRMVRTPVDWNIPADLDTSANNIVEITGAFREIPAEMYEVEAGWGVVAKETVEARIGYLQPAIRLIFEETAEPPQTDWTADDFTYAEIDDKRISTHAYYGITGLSEQGTEKLANNKNLVLPDTSPEGAVIEGIGKNAFTNIGLQSVQLPQPANSEFLIGASAFSDNELTEITIPHGVRVIDTDAFARNRLQSLAIPGSMFIIGNSAFRGNEIFELHISDDVRSIQIDNYSFADNRLTSVHLPYSLMKIREFVFANNTGMEPIPESERIPGDEKYGMVHLFTRNPLHLHTSTYIYGSRYQKIILVSEVDREPLFAQIGIAKNLSADDYTQESWTDLQLVLSNAREVFEDPNATEDTITKATANLKAAIENIVPISVNKKALATLLAQAQAMNPEMYTEDSWQILYAAMNEAFDRLADATVGQADVDAVQANLQQAMDQLIISEAARYSTEDFTFSGTTVTGFSPSGLVKRAINKHLIVPSHNLEGEPITAIGPDAFAMKDHEVSWGTDMVDSPNGLLSVALPETVQRIEDRAFRLNALTEIHLPDGIEFIGMQAFNGNQLTDLVLPDSVTELGMGVFSLNKLTSLTLSTGLTEIVNGAFSRNIHLTKVDIPEGVTVVGQAAFMGSPLKELVLPSTVHTVQRSAFSSHRIEHLVIPGTVTNIERNAFEHNVKYRYMQQLTLGEGIETIGNNAFKSGLLKEVFLPESLTSLSDTAFNDNLDENKQPIVVKLYTTNPAHLDFPESRYHIVILLESTVRFDANGGRFRRGTQTEYTVNEAELVLPTRAELGLARPGYLFEGWRVQGTEELLLPGRVYPLTGDVVFEAVWKSLRTDPVDPTVPTDPTEPIDPTDPTEPIDPDPQPVVAYQFDANGGRVRRGAQTEMKAEVGSTIVLPTRSELGLARPGYTFVGWRIQGTDEIVAPDTSYTLTNGIVFEAVWQAL